MVRMRRVKASIAAVVPLSLALVSLLTACSTSHPMRRPVNQSVVEQLESDGMYRTAEVYLSVKPSTRPAVQDSSTSATKTPIAAEVPAETERVRGAIEGVNLRELKLNIDGHGQRRIPLADIQRIEIKNRTLGLAEGLSGGLLGGVVAGGLFGALNTDYGCTGYSFFRSCPSIQYRLFVFGMSGGILAGCVGAFLGVLLGHTTTFTF
jgi:hypothetical protein